MDLGDASAWRCPDNNNNYIANNIVISPCFFSSVVVAWWQVWHINRTKGCAVEVLGWTYICWIIYSEISSYWHYT